MCYSMSILEYLNFRMVMYRERAHTDRITHIIMIVAVAVAVLLLSPPPLLLPPHTTTVTALKTNITCSTEIVGCILCRMPSKGLLLKKFSFYVNGMEQANGQGNKRWCRIRIISKHNI